MDYRDISEINQRLMNRWSHSDGRPVYWLLVERGRIVVRSWIAGYRGRPMGEHVHLARSVPEAVAWIVRHHYHGLSHTGFYGGLARQNILVSQHWLILRYTLKDVRDHLDEVISQVHALLEQAKEKGPCRTL